MFKLADLSVPIDWPVHVYVPQSGGESIKHTFYVQFLYKEDEEVSRLTRRRAPAGDTAQEEHGDGTAREEYGDADVRFFSAVMVGWRGVLDHDKTELQFTPDNLRRLLSIRYVKTAMISAYFEMLGGGGARKNSETPLATG